MARKPTVGKNAPVKPAARRAPKKAGVRGGVEPDAGAGRLNVRTVAVGKLNPAPYNPRVALKPGDAEYERIKASIDGFGYADPVIWNESTGNVVGGHQRLQVLVNEYRVQEIDVVVMDLGPAQERALNVALNKITGRWDQSKLTSVLREIDEMGLEMEITGFGGDELSALLDDMELDAAPPEPEGGGEALAYRVVIECDHAAHQATLLKEMKKQGLSARAVSE